MSAQDSIDRFCGYFAGQIETVRDLTICDTERRDSSQYQIRFYRKVLLINAVDTLAGIRYPKQQYPEFARRNRERFVTFLRDGRLWRPADYVSIPFLAERIACNEITSASVRDLVRNRMTSVNSEDGGTIDYRKVDIETDQVAGHAANDREARAISDCEHLNLLYRYRSYLVHESREPGTAMEIGQDASEPYYHGYLGETKLYLAYPFGLFIQLLENAVDYLKGYLEQHQLDPYEFVQETSRW